MDDDALRERLAEAEWQTIERIIDDIVDAAITDDIDTRTERASDLAQAVERILSDRLADVRAEAAREALREAADKMPVRVIGAVGSSLPHRWLRARADRIGGEQSEAGPDSWEWLGMDR